MAPRTAPTRKPTHANTIARELQKAILGGSFPPGSKLPGQRELAAQFGSSLPTVREAISILSATGMIEVRHGSGTIVRETAEARGALKGWLGMAINDKERRDFIEARILLETHIVGLIADHWQQADFAPLHAALSDMARSLSTPAAYLEADLQFHWELARCAGNTVLLRMLEAIMMPMRQQIEDAIGLHLSQASTLQRSYDSHVVLIAALERGDRAAALEVMNLMINRASGVLNTPDAKG